MSNNSNINVRGKTGCLRKTWEARQIAKQPLQSSKTLNKMLQTGRRIEGIFPIRKNQKARGRKARNMKLTPKSN